MQATLDNRAAREAARLTALNAYGILDTPRERDFDDVAALASAVCGTPIAVVNLIGEGRQFFKAEVGLGVRETPLDSSFCARAILEEEFLLIPDATKDPRFEGNPLVVGEPHLRFYAGALLRTEDGYAIGTVCVLDYRARDLTDVQQQTLRVLARQVMKQLELRRSLAARDAFIAEQEDVQREREALTDTQAAIAASGGDLDAVLDAVTAGVLRAVPAAEGAVVELIDGGDLEYRAVAGNLTPHRGLRVPLGDSLAGRCALSETPLLAPDVLQERQVKPHLAERLGMRTAALAPLSRAGRVVGVLKVQAGRPGALTERDLARVRLFAGAATSGLTEVAEAEAQRERRASDTRWRSLLEELREGFILGEVIRDEAGRVTDWRYVEVNKAWGELVGVDPASVAGRTIRGVFSGIEDVWVDEFAQVVETGQPATFTRQIGITDRWYEGSAQRTGPDTFVVLFQEITERVYADRALRASEARSRSAQEAGGVGTFEAEVDTGIVTVSEEFCRVFGLPVAPTYPGKAIEEMVVPEDHHLPSHDATRMDGSAELAVEYRIRRARDGSLRWLARRAQFEYDPSGKPVRMFGVIQDVTDRRTAQQRQVALLDLGDRLREAGSTDEIVGLAAEILGRTLDVTRAGYAIIDAKADLFTVARDWTAPGVATFVGQHRLSAFGATVDRLKRGETLMVPNVASAAWLGRDAGSYGSIGVKALIGIPLVQRGALVGVLFVHAGEARTWSHAEVDFAHGVVDRTYAALAKSQAEELQRVLNGELSHRLKNTLAMVQSIATQTLRNVSDREPVEAFEQRIHALSAAHDVLLRQDWTTAPMGAVARAVLGTFGSKGRLALSGPEISLGPRATLSLSLVLHELATNAAKYGALSNDGGRVDVRWRIDGVDGESDVVLDWEERGGPPVREPSRRGFGSRLIRMGLVGTGDVDLRYPASGFQAEMRAPLVELQQS